MNFLFDLCKYWPFGKFALEAPTTAFTSELHPPFDDIERPLRPAQMSGVRKGGLSLDSGPRVHCQYGEILNKSNARRPSPRHVSSTAPIRNTS